MPDPVRTRRGKRIVFIGNCQAFALGQIYRAFFANDRDETVHVLADVDLVRNEDNAGVNEHLALIAGADVVIEQVLAWRPPIDEAVRRARRHHRFPMVTGWFLWPFAGDAHPRNGECRLPGFEGPYPDEYGDSFLNRKLAEAASPEAAVDDYLRLDVARAAHLDRRFEILLDQQRQRDADTDFALAAVITRHLELEPLFTSRGHPTMRLFAPLAAGVFERMGIAAEDIARLIASLEAPPFPQDHMPIHPAVAVHFGLRHVTAATCFGFLNGRCTFEQFASRYLRFQWNEPLLAALLQQHRLPPDELLMMLDQGLAIEPGSVAGLCLRADVLQRLGRLDDALATAAAACAAPDGGTRPLILLSNVRRAAALPAAAADAARAALALHPFCAPAHAALAMALLDLGQAAAASASADRACAFAPADEHYPRLLAIARERAGQDSREQGSLEPRPARPERTPPDMVEHRVTWFDGRASTAVRPGLIFGDGWAAPENGFVWMIGPASQLTVPSAGTTDGLLIEMECWPHINDCGLIAQRLAIAVNGAAVADVTVSQHRTLRFPIGRAVSPGDGQITLSFLHPDAVAPAAFPDLANGDKRPLAIAVVALSVLFRPVFRASPGPPEGLRRSPPD